MKNHFAKRLARVFSLVLACTLILSCTVMTAFAVEAEEGTGTVEEAPGKKTGSITAYYTVDEKPIKDVEFSIYRLADFVDGQKFQWTSTFEGYRVTAPTEWSSDELNAMVTTLAGYVARDNIRPLSTLKTGEDGKAKFADLTQGMYLVIGKQYEVKSGSTTTTYIPTPFLSFFPYYDEATKGGKFDAEITVKHTTTTVTDTVSRHVLKVWDDSGYTGNRPTYITVDLLRDGKRYDTIELSSSNNWRYTWENLEGGHNYQLVESTVGGRYTTSTSMQGGTYVVTNTYHPSRPDPLPNPETPPTIITEEPPILSEYPFEPTVEIPETPTPLGPKIPQTGQLLWPIPVLAGAGIIALIAGATIGRKRKEEPASEEQS